MEYQYTDDQIIRMVQNGGTERLAALESFFMDARLRPSIIKRIQSKGGTLQDAEDAFHKAFIAFDRHLRRGNPPRRSNLRTWLSGICVRAWLDMRKKKSVRNTELTDEDSRLEGNADRRSSPDTELFREEKKKSLREALGLLGEKCRGAILMHSEGFSKDAIDARFSLGGPDNVRKFRYRCMEKLKKKMAEYPHLLSLLKSLRHV